MKQSPWRLGGIPILLLSLSCLSLPSDAAEQPAGELIVFHAGSLSVPLKEIVLAFQKEYPGVKALCEAAGSRESARKISDLGRPCDVLASADYAVIDTLLIPDHADWNIKFAVNEMVIAFTEASHGGGAITSENWPEWLLREEVAYGRSDPNADPCGYRTMHVLKLAETYYNRPGLADSLAGKDGRFMRPKETDLLALLETGAIDYIFIYRSVAEQHRLKWIALPDEINLKRPELASRYATVSVDISGDAPGKTISQRGEPMVYGVTIPRNAPNPVAARAFVAFLLEKERGGALLEKNGQPCIVPTVSDTFDKIPDCLKRFALQP